MAQGLLSMGGMSLERKGDGTMKTASLSCILVFVSAALMGCDPAGPRAMGTISLSEGVDPEPYQVLEIRLFEDEGEWTPVHGIPEEALITHTFEDWTTEDYLRSSERADEYLLTDIDFPFAYAIGPDMGSTHEKKWRVVAWLATEPASLAPESGDVWGTRTVEFEYCGGFGYCGTTEGVDIVLDQQVP